MDAAEGRRNSRLRPWVAVAAALLWSVSATPALAAPAKQAVAAAQPAPRAAPARATTAVAVPVSGKHRVRSTIAAGQTTAPTRRVAARASAPETRSTPSQRAQLRASVDQLGLKASAVLVMDQDTGEELYAKNADAVLPIASLTKLMTGVVLTSAGLPLDTRVTITDADVDRLKYSSSRLPVGTTLSRGEMMQVALMSSENRAAHALGRTYPGGLDRFVKLMNVHAQLLGMNNTHYVEPTGLSSHNQSTARDLARLVAAASDQTLLRRFTTTLAHDVVLGRRVVAYHNTNALLWNPDWRINLQKTGYIREAGRCLVMQTEMGGRRLIMVFLDSDSGQSRLADAKRVRQWVATGGPRASESYAYSN